MYAEPDWPEPGFVISAKGGSDGFGSYRFVENYAVKGSAVYAYEYDELIGPHGRVHIFWMSPGLMPIVTVQSSYDADTEAARERGEIGPDERIYRVDQFVGVGSTRFAHTLLKTSVQPLSYDEVKELARVN